MRQKSVPEKEPATQVVKNIRRATRRHFSAETQRSCGLTELRATLRRQPRDNPVRTAIEL
jgi:hypothetical protein